MSTADAPDSTEILLTYLHTTSHLDTLHATLLDSLSRAGWTTRVRRLAFDLIRSRKCTRFEDVVDTIVARACGPAGVQSNGVGAGMGAGAGRKRKKGGGAGDDDEEDEDENQDGDDNDDDDDEEDSAPLMNGHTAKKVKVKSEKDKKKGDGGGGGRISAGIPSLHSSSAKSKLEHDVKIPPAVVSQGAKFLRDTLDDLVTFGPDSDLADEGEEEEVEGVTNGELE